MRKQLFFLQNENTKEKKSKIEKKSLRDFFKVCLLIIYLS